MILGKLVRRSIVRLLEVEKYAWASCLSTSCIEMVVMIELVQPSGRWHRKFRFAFDGLLLPSRHYVSHSMGNFIKHWWFSGKIGRCHPGSSDLKCRPAPGSIPGRCMSIPARAGLSFCSFVSCCQSVIRLEGMGLSFLWPCGMHAKDVDQVLLEDASAQSHCDSSAVSRG